VSRSSFTRMCCSLPLLLSLCVLTSLLIIFTRVFLNVSVAVILNGKMVKPEQGTGYTKYSVYSALAHLAAGLCCGLCSLASGLAIGISADAGTRAVGAQSAMASSWKKMGFTGDAGGQVTSSGDALFVGTVLIQVFAGNLGLYGLISALILSQSEYYCDNGGN